MRRRLLRIAGSAVLVLVVLLAGAWLAFVPFSKEPSYEFVSMWGERGRGPGQFHDPTGIATTGYHFHQTVDVRREADIGKGIHVANQPWTVRCQLFLDVL